MTSDDSCFIELSACKQRTLSYQSSKGVGRGAGGKGTSTLRTLRRMTWGWVEGFLTVCKAFRRLDATEGTYLKEIQVRAMPGRVFDELESQG